MICSRSTFGSPYIALRLWIVARRDLGDDHPATRAASGRLLAVRHGRRDEHEGGAVPQRDSLTPEAVAWHREGGTQPGYNNRRWRRFLLQRSRGGLTMLAEEHAA